MWAKGSNFLPVVERSKVGLSEDEKSFPHTKFACFGDWVERLPSIQNFPYIYIYIYIYIAFK